MISSRVVVSVSRSALSSGLVGRAFFSSNCAAAEKLRCVFEEYRLEHYSRETPTRFKKDLIKVIADSKGSVEVDQLNNFLVNIGRSDKLLSQDEFDTLLHEAGATDPCIQAIDMMRLV